MEANKIEFENLYREALAFKEAIKAEKIKLGQIVVIQDPETDILGFCCLDKENKLSIHLGAEGLRGYLEMLYFPESYLLSRQTCLTLEFADTQELDVWDSTLLEDMGINLNANEKWPKFRSLLAGFLPETLKDGGECRYLTQALIQMMAIGEKQKENKNAFNLIGDEVIYCVHNEQGEWNTMNVSMNIFLEEMNNEKIAYRNELEAYRIKRLPTMNMTFEVTQFFLPQPVKKNQETRGFFPMVTAAFDSATKYLVFAEITDSGKESQEMILHKFAQTLMNDLQFKPSRMITNMDNVVSFFEDFCAKTSIELEVVSKLEAAEELMADLLSDADGKNNEVIGEEEGFEEEIDVLIDTAKTICKTILNSNLLQSDIAEEAKRQFTSIIELVHLVMLGNFKELPDAWTANNIEIAYKDILPEMLTEEEMKHVPEIISNYVEIVGNAEVLPNYTEIKNRMELMRG